MEEMEESEGSRFIIAWTEGMMQESSETRDAIERVFEGFSTAVDEPVYVITIHGKLYFIVDNRPFGYGYTVMLPREY